MNWDAIGAVGELVGATAVVVTLVYLSVQLRQNTAASQNATWQAILRQLGDLDVLEATTPGLSVLMAAAEENPESISKDEYRRFTRVAQPRFAVLEYAYLANENGTIDGFFWEALIPYARFLISKPGNRKFWAEEAHNVYHGDFIAFVETLMTDDAVPDA